MTFYEELGVPPDAPLETIRDAYRKVARLLHPDVQTDPLLKESAEAQMRRINHLYGILSDPDRRHRYDQELATGPARPAPVFIHAPPLPAQFQPGNSGTLVWLTAMAVGAGLIIWLAALESSSTPAVYTRQAPAAQPAVAQSLAPSKSPLPPRALVAAKTQPTAQRDEELAALRGQLLAATSDRERLEKRIAAREADHQAAGPVSPAPAPLIPSQPAPDIALPAVLPPAAAPPSTPKTTSPLRTDPPAIASVPRWSGTWTYHHAGNQNKDKALLPPEFIETVISEEKGRIHGRYHARFKVADASISPDVDFHFEGKLAGPDARFPWTGTGGAKGEVQLRLISDTTLEIVWSATSLGKTMGLASGTAVLSRKY